MNLPRAVSASASRAPCPSYPITDAQDNSLIDDGICTVQALRELRDSWKAGTFKADFQLQRIFLQGLEVFVLSYANNHNMCHRVMWNSGKHDRFQREVR